MANCFHSRYWCYRSLGQNEQAVRDLEAARQSGYPISERESEFLSSSKITSRSDIGLGKHLRPKEKPYSVFLTPEAGRGLKANRNIGTGEMIVVDDAYASVLEFDHLNDFCHSCLKRIQDHQIFPCNNCTQVRYCSMQCSQESQVTHRYECGYMDFLKSQLGVNASSRFLSMRIVLANRPNDVLGPDVQTSSDSLLPQNYCGMQQLVDHEKDGRVIKSSVTMFLVAFIMNRHPGYQNLTVEQQIRLAQVLEKHSRQTKWNAMSISYRPLTDSDFDPDVKNLKEDLIGVGLFFDQLLINHSCDPNIKTAGFAGRTVFLQAIKDIKEGEEILNSYGMFSRWQSYELRQKYLLENYCFKCNCASCDKKVEPLIRSYKCCRSNCNGSVIQMSCLNCGSEFTKDHRLNAESKVMSANQTIASAIKLFNKYLMQEEEDDNKLKMIERMLLDSYKNLRKNLYRDNRDVILTLDTICSFYLRSEMRSDDVNTLELADKLLKDTTRVFSEDVHLFNTLIKVIECYVLFSSGNRIRVRELRQQVLSLASGILPSDSQELRHFCHKFSQ